VVFVPFIFYSFFCPLGLNSGDVGLVQDDNREELQELKKVTHSSLVEMPVMLVAFLLLQTLG
jgi:hypothetical protein